MKEVYIELETNRQHSFLSIVSLMIVLRCSCLEWIQTHCWERLESRGAGRGLSINYLAVKGEGKASTQLWISEIQVQKKSFSQSY